MSARRPARIRRGRAPRTPTSVGALLLLAGLFASPGLRAQEPAVGPLGAPAVASPQRIVAIGDVHGAAGALRVLLRTLELVDEADDWAGGGTVLVQTGDFLDRGDSALAVAEWLRRLQEQAAAVGGRVHVLMGNHEALNLLGEYSDVTARILEPLVDAGSEERRRQLCLEQVPIRRARARAAGEEPPSTTLARNRCQAENPLGLVEYVERIGPGSPLGDWLRRLPGALVVGETLFVHGGISLDFAGWSPEAIDRALGREIGQLDAARAWLRETGRATATIRMETAVLEARRLVDEMEKGRGRVPEPIRSLASFQDWLLVRSDGPLWYRGWSLGEDAATGASGKPEPGGSPATVDPGAALDEVLAARGVRRMVVGHTPQKGGDISVLFGGRVFAIDTGMLTAVYRGRPAALEILGETVTAVTLEGRKVLAGPAPGTGSPSSDPP